MPFLFCVCLLGLLAFFGWWAWFFGWSAGWGFSWLVGWLFFDWLAGFCAWLVGFFAWIAPVVGVFSVKSFLRRV